MPAELTEDLRNEYLSLFSNSQVRPERKALVEATANKIIANRARYATVAANTNVPWFVIGIIHSLEASQRFDRHLHNGDPLTGRTIHVPAGHPAGMPPFTWEVSAEDALRFDKFDQWNEWTLPGVAFILERYNGLGYRKHHPQVKSPYLWSFTTIYSQGKYIKDNIFSAEAVSQQCGGMALLSALMKSDPTIAQALQFTPIQSTNDGEATRAFPVIDGPEDSEGPAEGEGVQPPPFSGSYIQNGSIGDAVKQVQLRLRALGIPPGTIDGEFGERTEEAVRVFQARGADLSGEPLEIDGIVGPTTWTALFQMGGATSVPANPPVAAPASPQLAQLVVTIADNEVGVREVPLGSNRGPRVNEYIRATGLDPMEDHYPWCMCFVYWCFEQASAQLRRANPAPKTGSVLSAWARLKENAGGSRVVLTAEARRDPSLVSPGSVFFLKTGASTGHTGIVAGNFNGKLETIEGNTNDTGSREGIGVFRRTKRRLDGINLGFVSFA
jgi:lysozyme family protein